MDWMECYKKGFVKEISWDKGKFTSFLEIKESKIEAAEVLPEKFYYSKITLLYDALRILLEIIALKNGYKIYNHECYTAFLKEILNLSREADEFDKIRKIRNSINYYGKKISIEEGKLVIKKIKELIKRFENFIEI